LKIKNNTSKGSIIKQNCIIPKQHFQTIQSA
jgi:hypothetical protein